MPELRAYLSGRSELELCQFAQYLPRSHRLGHWKSQCIVTVPRPWAGRARERAVDHRPRMEWGPLSQDNQCAPRF